MTQNLTNLGPKIALFEPDIPQNTAAIIRTCSCLGAILEIIEPCGFLLSDKRFKRVVMDYMDFEKIKFYKSSNEFFDQKKNSRIILMTTKAKKIYTTFNFKKNDEVITTSNTWISSAYAISLNGATPVFVDINQNNFQIIKSNESIEISFFSSSLL